MCWVVDTHLHQLPLSEGSFLLSQTFAKKQFGKVFCKTKKIEGQVYNVSILRICIVLLAEFGGKGERQENRPGPIYSLSPSGLGNLSLIG